MTSTEEFNFRDLHPNVFMGTASDRYAGWVGQIYSRDRYQDKISIRTKKVGGRTFQENVLPVESVEEYFQHFSILELDRLIQRIGIKESTNKEEVLRIFRLSNCAIPLRILTPIWG